MSDLPHRPGKRTGGVGRDRVQIPQLLGKTLEEVEQAPQDPEEDIGVQQESVHDVEADFHSKQKKKDPPSHFIFSILHNRGGTGREDSLSIPGQN